MGATYNDYTLRLRDSVSAYTPSVAKGTWSDGTPLVDKCMSGVGYGSIAGTTAHVGDGTSGHNYMLYRACVSDGYEGVFYAGDPWNGIISIFENNAAFNGYLYIHAWVTVGDSDTVRGTLINNYLSASEISTSSTTCGKVVSGTFYEDVAAQSGDHIIFEIGVKANTTNTSYYARLVYGGTGGLQTDGGDGNSLTSWLTIRRREHTDPTVTDLSYHSLESRDALPSNIIVTGTNFLGATTIYLLSQGSYAATFTVDSKTQITITALGNTDTAAHGHLVVVGAGGYGDWGADSDGSIFDIYLPVITGISPSSAYCGTTPQLTITGTDFSHVNAVSQNGVGLTNFTLVNSTTITWKLSY
jgi:hypothetical protein